MSMNKTSVNMWEGPMFSYKDIQRLVTMTIHQFTREGKDGHADYANAILTNARAMLNNRINENLNKHRIDRVLAIMTEVIDSPGVISVDLDKVDANKAEELVRRLNAALE